MLNKKKITKLLNPEFRKKILSQIDLQNPKKNKNIPAYARYVVDSQIIHRDKKFENDKTAYYGFNPIYPLCAILNDGTFDKRFFEFNIVNHFLAKKEGENAVEVVECLLIEWCKENKQIDNFDINKIDAELARIEHEYIEEQKKKKAKDEKINATGKEIQISVQPIIENCKNLPFEEVKDKLKTEIEVVMNRFKDNNKVFKYVIDLSRNTTEIINKGELFVDIGFNVEENDPFVVLVCHLNNQENQKVENNEQTATETSEQTSEIQTGT